METPKDNKEERDVLVEQARDAMQRGDRVMAIALLTQAIVNHPDNAEAYQLRGRVRYETGDIRGAKEDAEKMLRRCCNSTPSASIRSQEISRPKGQKRRQGSTPVSSIPTASDDNGSQYDAHRGIVKENPCLPPAFSAIQ